MNDLFFVPIRVDYSRFVTAGGVGDLVKMVISGGVKLSGEVEVSGAKNSALILMACALLASGPCRLINVPNISDVLAMVELLRQLDVKCTFSNGTVDIDATHLRNFQAPYKYVKEMRASVQVMGPLLGRLGRAKVSHPGGCELGSRPIDFHLKGFQELGAVIQESHGYIDLKAKELIGCDIYLDFPSVGATENIMAAAVLAKGTTIIHNAAREPEVIDEQNFLNCMGAKVRGAGTGTIRIDGVQKLHGVDEYSVIPDRIEAGTLIAAVAATRGSVCIRKVIPEHIESVIAKYQEIGLEIRSYDDSITILSKSTFYPVDVKSHPYPGFPTDMQPQTTSVLVLCDGVSTVTENVFDSRFKHIDELRRMGADISIQGRTAIIRGVKELSGAEVTGSDLRATAALVIAGLAAKGETKVDGLQHLDRGYEGLERKLLKLGAILHRE